MKNPIKAWGKIYPPYIDAYVTAPYESLDNPEKGWTFKEFCNELEKHAASWGTQSIGEQVLHNDLRIDGEFGHIWCVGFWNHKNYALIAENGWYYNPSEGKYKIIEFDYPEAWNVT